MDFYLPSEVLGDLLGYREGFIDWNRTPAYAVSECWLFHQFQHQRPRVI